MSLRTQRARYFILTVTVIVVSLTAAYLAARAMLPGSETNLPCFTSVLALIGLVAGLALIALDRQVRLRHVAIEAMTAQCETEQALRVSVEDLTRQLSEAHQQLQKIDLAKDLFVSSVSHELRAPLTNIILYLHLLEHGKPERRDDYMQTLRREAARLDKMIEDLLDLSQLDLGVTKVEPVSTNLNDWLRQLLSDRMPLAAERGLTLKYEPAPDLPRALIDPARLAEVVTNLVTNAIHYTPPGGTIWVSTEVRQAEQTWVTFTVRDTGYGLSAKERPHLFERFYRGEVGRKASALGTGLGLAISKEIVDRLGGRITLESEPGEGAIFRVWLRPASE